MVAPATPRLGPGVPTRMPNATLSILCVALLSGCSSGHGLGPASEPPADPGGPGPGATVVTVAVASDIAQAGRTEYARETAALVTGHTPAVSAVLLGGDNARFGVGASGISLLDYYRTYYAPPAEGDWGQLDDLAFPQSGNHEYAEADARGYFDYFAARFQRIVAMPSYHGDGEVVGKGWYSFDINGWHVVSLNSECSAVGGCEQGSAEELWLAIDLAAHASMPIIAVWHEPRYSCGGHGDATELQAFWADLYAAHADFVFSGHNHFYQRYKPLDAATPEAQVDTAGGLTQVVAGSGGVGTYDVCAQGDARLVASVGGDESIGVFFLELGSDGGYRFEYRRAGDGAVLDSGAGMSHHPL